ncbi:hypothetical protein BH11BAC7_BH11BAC7_28720 [soil metagenome]
MNETEDQLKALSEMRDLMNRSSRFLSLSGLSGICAGVFALIGAAVAWKYLYSLNGDELYGDFDVPRSFYSFFFVDAGLVLLFSLMAGWYFSNRRANRAGVSLFDETALRMLANLFIPLATGGLFCFALLYYGVVGLIAPATLIFYGLALLNASKYTVKDIRFLGICQIVLGLISTMFIFHGLIFWAIGFGVLHIIYGTVLYFKYERV